MKAILISQPWATLIARGAKCIVTKEYPIDYTGDVLLFAAPEMENDAALVDNEFVNWFIEEDEQLPVGCIIGKVSILRIDPVEKLIAANKWPEAFTTRKEKEIEFSFDDYRHGRYAWTLCQPVEFKIPLPLDIASGILSNSPNKVVA